MLYNFPAVYSSLTRGQTKGESNCKPKLLHPKIQSMPQEKHYVETSILVKNNSFHKNHCFHFTLNTSQHWEIPSKGRSLPCKKISNCTESRPFQILTNIVLLWAFIGFLWFSIVFYGFSINGYLEAGAEFFVGLKVHVELSVQFSHLEQVS